MLNKEELNSRFLRYIISSSLCPWSSILVVSISLLSFKIFSLKHWENSMEIVARCYFSFAQLLTCKKLLLCTEIITLFYIYLNKIVKQRFSSTPFIRRRKAKDEGHTKTLHNFKWSDWIEPSYIITTESCCSI